MVGGIGLAMSSTAMALQLMREKGMNRSESGQLGFSVLLFQDLAVILRWRWFRCWRGLLTNILTGLKWE